ncbi:MAG: GvpL/GvpF family gas vesicle protein [Gallionella sp.]
MSDGQAHALYLYCLARPACQSAAASLLGVDERYPIRVLAHDANIVAVVSEIHPADFSEQNLQNLAWLGVRAQRHEIVVARMMAISAVLPVKFGTLFQSADSLQAFMARHQFAIATGLDTLAGKAEWSVKAYLVDADARPRVIADSPEIQAKLANLSTSPGIRYIQQRQLDGQIDAALQTWVKQMVSSLHEALLSGAEASSALRCHAQSITGRTDRMIYNTAFLLSDAALANFQAALAEQKMTYQDSGLTLELKGPWPPYNFCPTLSEGVNS